MALLSAFYSLYKAVSCFPDKDDVNRMCPLVAPDVLTITFCATGLPSASGGNFILM